MSIKRLWRNPAFRRRRSRAVSQFMKRRWQNPAFRAYITQALLRKWQDPAFRRQQSDTARRQWQNPAMRRRMEAAMRRPWRDPKHVRRMSRISKARWRDPRYRPLLMANAKRALGPSRGAYALHALLGKDWILEYWTTQGPIDIACPALKLAIEVDDPGHRRTKQRLRDRKKTRGLERLGWSVFRISESACRALPKGGGPCGQ
jgi:hypothetical protein